MFKKEIKAKDGCIIYFPTRKESGKISYLIKGAERTKKKRKEEWVQIRANEIIELEDRKENDNAANLGNSLFCEVVSKLKVRINPNYPDSIPKVVEKLLCTTTDDVTVVVNSRFFSESLMPNFKGIVQKIINKLSYLQLLQNNKHREDLEKEFNSMIEHFANDYGFEVIETSIRFNPLEPENVACSDYKEIAAKFISWDKIKKELELQKTENQLDLKQKETKLIADKAFEAKKNEKEIEKREKEYELENIKELASIEKYIVEEQCKKDEELARERKKLKDFYNSRQEELDKYDHQQEIEKINRKKELFDEENKKEEQKRANDHKNELIELQHNEGLLDRRLLKLKKEKEIILLEMEIEKNKGITRTEIELLTAKNVNYIECEILSTINNLIDRLPEITKNLPTEKIGDSTIISIGDKENSAGLNYSLFGYSILPVFKKFIKEIVTKIKYDNQNTAPNNV